MCYKRSVRGKENNEADCLFCVNPSTRQSVIIYSSE